MAHLSQSAGPLLGLLGLTLLGGGAGCDFRPFDPASKLSGYRLLAIEVDHPEPPPDGQLTVRVIEHDDEPERARSYRYTLCPYSFGGAANYACLLPELEVELEAEADGSLHIDLATQRFGPYVGLEAALEPVSRALISQLEGRGMQAPPLNPQTLLALGVDLWIGLESGPADQPQRSVRSVQVRLPQAQRCALASALSGLSASDLVCAQDLEGAEREAALRAAHESEARYLATVQCCSPENRPVGLEAIHFEGAEDLTQIPAGEALELSVQLAPDALQVYWSEDALQRCVSASDPTEKVEGGPCQEQPYYRWYASAGKFKYGTSYEDATGERRSARWTAPREPGPVQIYVVAFDGRGGVSALSQEVQVR